MIKTAIVTVQILSMDDNKLNINSDAKVDLKSLLEEGYRIKIVNDVLYHDIVFAHYVLEKEL